MSEIKIKRSIANLEKFLKRLQEALSEPKNNALIIDGTVQRFEFVIELFWKTLKRALALEGIETDTPKDVLKKAYAVNWIEDETTWLQMLNDRNKTSHIYDQGEAEEIYQHIHDNYPELQRLFDFLKKRFSQETT